MNESQNQKRKKMNNPEYFKQSIQYHKRSFHVIICKFRLVGQSQINEMDG